jgi:hypothetical protein
MYDSLLFLCNCFLGLFQDRARIMSREQPIGVSAPPPYTVRPPPSRAAYDAPQRQATPHPPGEPLPRPIPGQPPPLSIPDTRTKHTDQLACDHKGVALVTPKCSISLSWWQDFHFPTLLLSFILTSLGNSCASQFNTCIIQVYRYTCNDVWNHICNNVCLSGSKPAVSL